MRLLSEYKLYQGLLGALAEARAQGKTPKNLDDLEELVKNYFKVRRLLSFPCFLAFFPSSFPLFIGRKWACKRGC